MAAMAVGGAKNPGTVTLSGEAIVGTVEEFAEIRFNIDGTVEKSTDGVPTYVQIDAAADWLRPPAPPDFYSVRYTSATGDPFSSGPAVEDTWIALTENRTWRLNIPAGAGSDSITCTFEIRDDLSGITLDSASYSLTTSSSG